MRLPGCLDRGSAADFDGISMGVVKSTGQNVDPEQEKRENDSEGFLVETSPNQTGKGESNV